MSSHTRLRPAATLNLEALEARTLMAAKVTATLANGVLRVQGTETNDRIVVRQINGQVSVANTPIRVGNRLVNSVSANAVRSVAIDSRGGNDTVNAAVAGNAVVNRSMTINGGTGNDTLIAGNGNDQVQGGSGNDRLVANNGNDVVNGGTGNDTMTGGNGNDRVLVQGDDVVTDLRGGIDALVRFTDGLKRWLDSEIAVIDAALARLQNVLGSSGLAALTSTLDLTFERDTSDPEGETGNGTFVIGDDLFGQMASQITARVMEEIQSGWQNFQSTFEMPWGMVPARVL